MATAHLNGVIRGLGRLLAPSGGPELSDADLLDRFIAHQDQPAFAALVRRHGPMVLDVCRRVLGHEQDAEDAFQAAFLVLARKAASIGRPGLLANWLYGAAYRAALEARAARRRVKERPAYPLPDPTTPEPRAGLDLLPLLDREVSRLPDKYRAAIVLCDLEGRAREDAARQLGLPVGTLSGRLTTARRLLAGRLARHGVTTLGAATPAAALVLPARLTAAALQAAGGTAPSRIALLADGVLRAMFVSQLKFIPALLLAAALLGAGAGSLPGRAPLATAPRAPRQALSREAPKKPAEAKPAAKARQAALAKALEVAREIDTRETSPEVKIFLLCRVAQAQLQAGGTKAALETLGLASPLVKGVKSLIVRSTCFAQVGAGQASAGDIKAARKTLADLEKLREATTDQNVLLNSGFGRDGLLGAIAAAEARAGDDKAALKAARDIEDVHRQVAALRGVARAQAARKNFAGATETVALAESTRAAEMYMDIALIQEKTDKAGAEKTWKRALASLTKLELNKDDLRQHNLRALLPALAERGHAEALRKWADGLSPPEVQVEVLLILARGG